MEITREQRLAICRVLLDVVESMDTPGTITEARHYPAFHRATRLSGQDWEEARRVGVLASLVILKELHYRTKMMLGLVVYDLIAQEPAISYRQRISFDVLMGALEWPVSFTEISQLP